MPVPYAAWSLPVRFEHVNRQLKAYLNQPLHVNSWVIPAGFETDFASVPRLFWNILPPIGLYTRAAIVHDYLYQTGLVSRKEADLIFLQIMKTDEVDFFVRHLMYYAVRIFGGRHYHECQCKI
jgi:hypothetical protein